MLLSRFTNNFVCICHICVLYVPSYSEVKRVYDVCQYIFSGVECMCWTASRTCIIYSPSTPAHAELWAEECHPALGRWLYI